MTTITSLDQAQSRIHELEYELECMSGVMRVMKEDLQASFIIVHSSFPDNTLDQGRTI